MAESFKQQIERLELRAEESAALEATLENLARLTVALEQLVAEIESKHIGLALFDAVQFSKKVLTQVNGDPNG